jgi:hypothetical protein
MVPMRTSTIFKSRWMALLWAAGIIWFAYDFAGSEAQGQSGSGVTSDGNAASDEDANQIAQVLGN